MVYEYFISIKLASLLSASEVCCWNWGTRSPGKDTLAAGVGSGAAHSGLWPRLSCAAKERTWVRTAALNHGLNPVFMGKREARSQGTGDTLTQPPPQEASFRYGQARDSSKVATGHTGDQSWEDICPCPPSGQPLQVA